jgi:site-specific DNA-methyltransferase (adenine-specific)
MQMVNRSLFFGDNLEILREKFPGVAGYFDLIYLDPPFNSNRNYNVIFKEGLVDSEAQTHAFEDSWHWTHETQAEFKYLVTSTNEQVSNLMLALEKIVGHNDVLAYSTMMSVRLLELHRVLKTTGSIFLHCDPTASHYLKLILDAIFGKENFRNEIIWRRTGAHGKAKKFTPIHDSIFYYTKGSTYKWNYPKKPYMKGHVEEYFTENKGVWKTQYYGNVLTGSGLRGGESGKAWKGFDPSAKGRHWAIPGALIEDINFDFSGLTQHQKLDKLLEMGFIKIIKGQAWPIYEREIKPGDGTAMPDIWAFQPYTGGTVFGTKKGIDEDVRWLSPSDKERLGYQTQKPEGLLNRIISAVTEPGDLVLDPFCGCGTTVSVAEKLKRSWVGIDISMLAVKLIERRLIKSHPCLQNNIFINGLPKDMAAAKSLATKEPFDFEYWVAVHLLDSRPPAGKSKENMRGADKGVDGVITLITNTNSGNTEYGKVIVQVKGGHVKRSDIATFKADIDSQHAIAGVFVTLEKPTGPMRVEEAQAGKTTTQLGEFPIIQILTVEDLLNGKRPNLPGMVSPYKQALTFNPTIPQTALSL